MDFEVTSLYDPDNEALELLRRSRSSITVELIDPRSHSRYEVHLPVSWPADVALATLAEQLQDHAVESTEGYGRALPPCPIHPVHPLSPLPIDGIAVWRCPATRKVIGPVGRLSSGGSGSDSASP
jgi:hypothetical protein